MFAPFHGAHFGWGHPWSFDWKGIEHLPTVPISMPLYEGSGGAGRHLLQTRLTFRMSTGGHSSSTTGCVERCTCFQPEWDGAFRRHQGGGFPSVFAHAEGGRSLPASSGRVFEPTDIEVGPDGALYVLSWGHGYGGTIKDGKQVDAGRVYRIRHAGSDLIPWDEVRRRLPLTELSNQELLNDLGSSVPAWRVNAQNELLRRGESSVTFLGRALRNDLPKAQQTWALWTLGRLSPDALMDLFETQKNDINVHLQTLRILAQEQPASIDNLVAWESDHARLRHATVQAVWRSSREDMTTQLIDLAARESDRVVFTPPGTPCETWYQRRD